MSDAGPRRSDSTDRLGGATDGGDSWRLFARDLLTSVLAVMLVGAYLFAVSGVWPPLVAVESGSMQPNMERNDLVFVMDEERFSGAGATGATGVVTAATGEDAGHRMFGQPGDVIVYKPNGSRDRTPIIHRAMFWVEEGEDWVARADESFLARTDSCSDIETCPAEHAGFVTKGDNNGAYDQVPGRGAHTGIVAPEWIVGTAEVRVPGLGWFRLRT